MAERRAWYEFCVAYQRLPAERRKKAYQSKTTREHFARIARLPRRFGEALDENLAPLRCYQFLASVPDRPQLSRMVAQGARFEELRSFYRLRRRWPLPHEVLRMRRSIDEKLGLGSEGAAEVGPLPPLGPQVTAHALALSVQHHEPELANVLRLYADHPELAVLLQRFAEEHGYGGGGG
jgi:hypothetical protein